MSARWPTERVLAAAPDEQVRRDARRLAVPTPWREVGASGSLLWGQCQGSGAKPYQVSVDTNGPVYKCSCPSRKFPCKHALALLLIWAAGNVDETTGIADYAAQWAAERADREARTTPAAPAAPRTPEQEAAAAEQAAQRLAQRDARVDDGLIELDRWLRDQVTQGLAVNAADRGSEYERMAARLVDAQAPGVAGVLRELSTLTDASPDWPTQIVDAFGRLRLLISAWQRRDQLPDDVVTTLRQHIGFTTRTEDVLAAEPGVADSWLILGMNDAIEERVSVRRVWLWGRQTGRPALVLFFAAKGEVLQSNLVPGHELAATLHFYPGRPALRAAIGQRASDLVPIGEWRPAEVADVTGLREQWRHALGADPWLDELPALVAGRIVHAGEDRYAIWDGEDALPLLGPEVDWRAAIAAAGAEVVLCGELDSEGLTPTAVVREGQVKLL